MILADLSGDSILNAVSNMGASGLFAYAIYGLLKYQLQASRDDLAAERKFGAEERDKDRAACLEGHKELLARIDKLTDAKK